MLRSTIPTLLLAAFVWIHDTHGASLPSVCSYDTNIVVCRESHRVNLKTLAATVMMDYIVTIVYLKSYMSLCSCKTVHFIKRLRHVDILVLTTSRCTVKTLISCGVKMPLEDPIMVAGLVVSRKNPKLRWGVKHYLLEICNKVEDLPDARIRATIYRSFVLELREEEKRLEKIAISKGELMYYHEIVTVADGQSSLTKTSAPVKASKDREIEPSQLAGNFQSEAMVHLIGSIQNTLLTIGAAEKKTEAMFTDRASEPELQIRLKNELKDIRTHKFKVVPREALHKPRKNKTELTLLSEFLANKYQSDLENVYGSSHTRLVRTAKARVSLLLPQKAFVDGEYVSIFDTNSILEDLELEASLPELINPFTTIKPQIPPEVATLKPLDEPKNPVAKMLFPSEDEAMAHAIAHGMIELQDDDVDDDLINEDTYMVDTTDPGGEAKIKLKSITKVPRVTDGPIVPITAKNIKDLQAEHRESDHRIKSFIIFFIAILGIIGIIGVLLILALKKRPTKDKYTIFDVPRRRTGKEHREIEEHLLRQHEALMNKRRKIQPYYSDVEADEVLPVNDPIMRYRMRPDNSKSTQTGKISTDQFLDNRTNAKRGVNSSNSVGRTLGGRHVYSEFARFPYEDTDKPKIEKVMSGLSPWLDEDQSENVNKVSSTPPSNVQVTRKSGRKKIVDFNLNRSSSNVNGTKLVSFLESLNNETCFNLHQNCPQKDGVIRDNHRDHFNIKQYLQQQKFMKRAPNVLNDRPSRRLRQTNSHKFFSTSLEPTLKIHTAKITHFSANVKPVKKKEIQNSNISLLS